MPKQIRKPIAWYLLFGLMLFQGASGVFGGAALLWDPSGSLISLPLSFLKGTPFNNFFLPGSLLFTVLGIFPLIVLTGLWRHRAWSWLASLLVSIGLIIWIMVEILMIGYHSNPPLQLIYGLTGILLFALVFTPSVRTELLKKST